MLNEHNQLRMYSEADSELDIASDPLVFLGCGHVIHMRTMDHYMSLDQVYNKGAEGRWEAPCQLGVCMSPADLVWRCMFARAAVSLSVPVILQSTGSVAST